MVCNTCKSDFKKFGLYKMAERGGLGGAKAPLSMLRGA